MGLRGFLAFCLPLLTPSIVIDGKFDDWDGVLSYYDPAADINGTVLDRGVHDVHETDNTGMYDFPPPTYNPHVDLLEWKFTHDAEHVYLYARSAGEIGKTSKQGVDGPKAGVYLAIGAINIDNNITTGMWLHQGGYYPTSGGYDVVFECIWYNGSFNEGVGSNHGMQDADTKQAAMMEMINNGVVGMEVGLWKFHAQYVMWGAGEMTADERMRCQSQNKTWAPGIQSGPFTLPTGEEICFVDDRSPGPFNGKVKCALDDTKTQIEFSGPLELFMKNEQGKPNLKMGQYIGVTVSLEASAEYSTPSSWASDSAGPILYYYLQAPETDSSKSKFIHTDGGVAFLFLFGIVIGAIIMGVACWFSGRRKHKRLIEIETA